MSVLLIFCCEVVAFHNESAERGACYIDLSACRTRLLHCGLECQLLHLSKLELLLQQG